MAQRHDDPRHVFKGKKKKLKKLKAKSNAGLQDFKKTKTEGASRIASPISHLAGMMGHRGV